MQSELSLNCNYCDYSISEEDITDIERWWHREIRGIANHNLLVRCFKCKTVYCYKCQDINIVRLVNKSCKDCENL